MSEKIINAVTLKAKRDDGSSIERKYPHVNPDITNDVAISGVQALSSLSKNTDTAYAVTTEYFVD